MAGRCMPVSECRFSLLLTVSIVCLSCTRPFHASFLSCGSELVKEKEKKGGLNPQINLCFCHVPHIHIRTHTNTHTHTHTHTLSLSLSLSHAHTICFQISVSLFAFHFFFFLANMLNFYLRDCMHSGQMLGHGPHALGYVARLCACCSNKIFAERRVALVCACRAS